MPKTKTKSSRSRSTSKKNKSLIQKINLKDRKVFGLFIAIIALIGVVVLGLSNAATGYTEIFVDDFNGTSVNTANWKPYHSTYGDGNNETHCYTPDNAVVSNGTLKLITKKEDVTCPSYSKSLGWATPYRNYTSGALSSKDAGKYYPKYGRYEFRAKSPQRLGLVPAMWLRHVNGSSTLEIDVLESFQSAPGTVTATIHAKDNNGVTRYNEWKRSVNIGTNPSWHTWAVEIDEIDNDTVEIRFYLDGQLLEKNGGGAPYRITGNAKDIIFDSIGENGFDIALNTAVNFNYGGNAAPDSASWHCTGGNWYKVSSPSQAASGDKVAETPLKNADGSTFYRACKDPRSVTTNGPVQNNPAGETFEIDYVKVSVPSSSTTPTPTPTPTPEPAPEPTPEPAPDATSLTTPVNVKATGSNGSVTLTWDEVAGADNYTVRWGTGGSWSNYSNDSGSSNNPTTGSYTVNGLTNGTTYNFAIAARDNTGKYSGSSYTSAINATPNNASSDPEPTPTPTPEPTPTPTPSSTDTQPPSTPANLIRSLGANIWKWRYDLNLNWQASTDNVAVTDYVISRDGTQIGTSKSTSYTDGSIKANRQYIYSVVARDAAGNISGQATTTVKANCVWFVCALE